MRTRDLRAIPTGACCIAAGVLLPPGREALRDGFLPPRPDPIGYGFYHDWYPTPDTTWFLPLVLFVSIYCGGGVLAAYFGSPSWRRAARSVDS